jgi:hypothetical protein
MGFSIEWRNVIRFKLFESFLTFDETIKTYCISQEVTIIFSLLDNK